ncbi:protein Skeletor: isoforms D/E-like protein, partial [Dinothrombium tinctorium]
TVYGQQPTKPYYGTPLGKLKTHAHGVSGEVFVVDESTLFIKDFNYDGTGPDAYFWGGFTSKPDTTGFIIPDEKGSTKKLSAYRNKNLVLRLPEGNTVRDLKWFSVWCRKAKVNFGDVPIPRNLVVPTPVEIAPLSQLAHGLKSGPVTIVDAQTFLIPDFHYDGLGPAAYWWATKGPRQGPGGVHLDDENGSQKKLRRYAGETVVISLPEGKTIWDFDFFGVWCVEFQVDFGHTRIPHNVLVPPSPRMLGVKPESKLNCEVLYDALGFEIRWVMDGDDIVMQLVGRIAPNEYMAFGLGKDDSKSSMINADAVVTWYDRETGRGNAVDYYLQSKEQCVGNRGSCPDLKHSGASDSYSILHAAVVNDFTMITFKRPQLGVDEVYDQHVYSDGPQAVLWAIGPLNDRKEVSYHRLRTNGNLFIDFARTPKWNCPNPDSRSSTSQTTPSPTRGSLRVTVPQTQPRQPVPSYSSRSPDAWDIPPIICPADNTFRAQIGPTGGKKGYESITGKVGWGIAWYINGLLIPEITVQRGKTYTFIVEGGDDPVYSSRRHPLYITDSSEGGFDYKSEEERKRERIFAGAGITRDGKIVPTAEGRYCEWKIDTRRNESPEDFSDFFSFQRTLKLDCEKGQPAILKWTPDHNTPDIVYYQCYTHRYLGWKIRVVDSCDYLASASITSSVPHRVAANSTMTKQHSESISSRPKSAAKKKRKQKSRAMERSQNHSTIFARNETKKVQPLISDRFESRRIHSNFPQEIPELSAVVYQAPPSLPGAYIPQGAITPLNVFIPPMLIRPRFSTRPIVYLEEPQMDTPDSLLQMPPSLPQKTTDTIKESRIGQNLHGGFLPLLINSKNSTLSLSQSEINRIPKKNSTTSKKQTIPFKRLQKPEVSINFTRLGIPRQWYQPPVQDFNWKRKKETSKPETLSDSTPKPNIVTEYANGENNFENAYPAIAYTVDDVTLTSGDRGSYPSSSFVHDVRVNAENLYDKRFNNRILKATAKESSHGSAKHNENLAIILNKDQFETVGDTRNRENKELPTHSNAVDSRPKIPLLNITTNGTDDAILSHIMSLIAEGATPPEVKISSQRKGSIQSTHVEIHRKSVHKRSIDRVSDHLSISSSNLIKQTFSNVVFIQSLLCIAYAYLF